MRGTVVNLRSPFPLEDYLPGILQEDTFTTRLTAAFDEVLAPVIAVLDCLDAYIDPDLAPPDFERWIGSWLALDWDESWPVGPLRTAVSALAQCHASRGTPAGLRRYLELLTGGRVELVDNGGVAWSLTPEASFPGEEVPRLAVRVTVPTSSWFTNETALDEVVAAEKPAHVQHQVQLVRTEA
jgi:phage tail-like protein